MCQLYHIPKQIMHRHVRATSILMECADLVARKRYGVPALMLPTEQRELVISYLEDLWAELDALTGPERAS